ncbi:MAG: CDF family Co(II)/Ni(II) efflux transporter DmeF [Steroidobacteraceae bacterium]
MKPPASPPHPHDRWSHRHDFVPDAAEAERSTGWVMVLTAITMVAEIIAGTLSGSMALLADGWHMATHVAAFAIAIFAYRYARTRAADASFAFGTGKVTVLGGFASAVALAVVALMMAIESVKRLMEPLDIRFDEAIWVACIGLAVNVLSGVILHRAGHAHEHHGHAHGHPLEAASGHAHDHDHEHEHEHADAEDHGSDRDHGHAHAAAHHGHGPMADSPDHNLRAAYLHVVADALTSVLAIVALFAGKYLGLGWLDAAMGLVGAALITRWAWGLAQDSATILLDRSDDPDVGDQVRAAIAAADPGASVADLHVWPVAPARFAAAVTLVSHRPRAADYYRARLAGIGGLTHVTVEVNECREPACPDLR